MGTKMSKGMVLFQFRIYRSDLQLNPHVIYCFGDNDMRVGKGGQAKECRGEPNSFGIRTKREPNEGPNAYYTDATFDENCAKIDEDFGLLEKELEKGSVVVMPTEGFGTGLAMLKENAPRTLSHVNAWVERLADKYGVR